MYINSVGYYIPERRVGNEYFTELNGLTPEWILQRTGINTRSRAGEGENVNTMGLTAAREALSHLPYDVKDINLVVASHYCAYDTVATLAHVAQREFGLAHAKAVYASSACSSFINGLEIVEGYFAMGKADKAMLLDSEHNTYYSNDKNPKDGHLWGDAAVVWCISKERQSEDDIEIKTVFTEGLGDTGKGPGGVKLTPKEDGILMSDGRDVFLHACKYMIYALDKALAQAGLERKDIDCFITHQANMRIVAQVAHMLDLPMEKFRNNIEELGNTGSASAPLVFSQQMNEIKKGEKVALMVFGGGYSCGCFILER